MEVNGRQLLLNYYTSWTEDANKCVKNLMLKRYLTPVAQQWVKMQLSFLVGGQSIDAMNKCIEGLNMEKGQTKPPL